MDMHGRIGIFGAVAVATVALCTGAVGAEGDTLTAVQAGGQLLCPGYNGSYPPYAEVDDKGNWKGQDTDLCRALAAAIFSNDISLNLSPNPRTL